MSRILQQQYTTIDEPSPCFENPPPGETFSADDPGGLAFAIPFFLVWNILVGSQVSVAILYLLRCKCHESAIFLVCPHWIVGIVVPTVMTYSIHGLKATLLVNFGIVVVPYGLYVIYHIKTNDELHGLYSSLLCCRCCRCRCSRDSNSGSNVREVIMPTRSPQRNSEARQRASSSSLSISSSEVSSSLDGNDIISLSTIEKDSTTTTTTDSTDSGLLIIKKVVRKTSFKSKHEATMATKENKNDSFRSNNPKSDICIDPTNSNAKSKAKSASRLSVQPCAICLEEYCVGDDIAYSKNPSCHHYFHKQCVIDLLEQGHEECPICRSSYIISEDIELGNHNNNNN